METPRHALVARGLRKSFGGVPALCAVDLTIAAGEVHALLGENGSGKSTFIKILSGYHRPDDGQVLVGDRELTMGSPDAAYALGCRFVHQDLGLIATLSVLDNLFLNAGFPTRFGTVLGGEARRRAREQLSTVGLGHLDTSTSVAALSPAERTGVAVARALLADSGSGPTLLVLDEPTATLPDDEVVQLMAIVRRVAARGVGVLYVTHRLDEVFEIADTVTVLSDGVRVATDRAVDLDRRRLVNLLVGDQFDEIHASVEAMEPEHGDPVLEVDELDAGPVHGLSFRGRAGDVIGIAGITGSGRETLLGALFGATVRTGGTVRVAGREVQAMRPSAAMALGMAYLPPDRKVQGGLQEFSARENLTLSRLSPFWKGLRLHRKDEAAETKRWFERLDVRPVDGYDRPLATFSGGNQQKVLFGKWLRLSPQVFLLDEPTQGVDIGAKAELHRQLLKAAQDGTVVVISSSDVDELAAVCRRVLVLREGRVVADLTGRQVSIASITRECLGTDRKVVAL